METIPNKDYIFGGRITQCSCTGPISYLGMETTCAGNGSPRDNPRTDNNRKVFTFKCLGCQEKVHYRIQGITKQSYKYEVDKK